MGLDMYLSARKYISRIDFSKADTNTETLAFRQIIDTTETTRGGGARGILWRNG